MQSSDSEKVELYISCRDLKNMDFFSKSDPEVRLYSQNNGKWNLIGKTEMINDNLNPNFSKCFTLDFVFEVQQPLKFEVVDIDGPNKFDYIGSVETTLGKIMGAKKQTFIGNFLDTNGKVTGKIIVRGERQGTSQNVVSWQWSGVKLMNTDGWFFDKSDPFLRIFKKRDDGEWLQVHETEVIMNNLNPIWKMFEVKDDKLCGGDPNKPIRIECWDWESDGKNQYIGDCEVTLEMLKNRHTEFDLHHPKKKKKTGTLKLLRFSLVERPSFLEFIRGGEQLSVVVAIDFTGSNGHPSRSDSLHARNLNGQMNQYQKAITSVCQILLNYDYDQKVPVFGFGGKPHYPALSSTVVSHCFPCSGDLNQNEVMGLDGILGVYDYALNNCELSGPTFFAPIITEAIKLAHCQKAEETGVYTILLILTDGEIHDMDQTIDAICTASHLPLSIIIVGVGNADFGKMEILDGDEGLYNSRGQKAQRDLVQFVPFRNFQGNMVQLAQHVLAEVPDQLVEYMRLTGRKPRPPIMVDMEKVGYGSSNTLQTLPTLKQGDIQEGVHRQPRSSLSNASPMAGGVGSYTGVSPINASPMNASPMNMHLNQEVLAQNPYLMNAGANLIQGAMGNGSPQVYGQFQQQFVQPAWMAQPEHVTLQSFGMTESVNVNTLPQNQNPNMYPRYHKQNHIY